MGNFRATINEHNHKELTRVFDINVGSYYHLKYENHHKTYKFYFYELNGFVYCSLYKEQRSDEIIFDENLVPGTNFMRFIEPENYLFPLYFESNDAIIRFYASA